MANIYLGTTHFGKLGEKTSFILKGFGRLCVGDMVAYTDRNNTLNFSFVARDERGYFIMGWGGSSIEQMIDLARNFRVVIPHELLTVEIMERYYPDFRITHPVKMTKQDIEVALGYEIEVVEGE